MPGKQGIHYFPFDLNLIGDRKFRALRSVYGIMPVMVYLSLLSMIYRDRGYYLEYNPHTQVDVIWEVMKELQGKDCPTEEQVKSMISGLADAAFFDPFLFQRGILTSHSIQTNFYRITNQRKYVEIDFSIWLLSESEMRAMSGRHRILELYLEQGACVKTEENHADFEKNKAILRQRKEKERKEEKRKEDSAASADLSLRYGHVRLSKQEYNELMENHSEEQLKKAIAYLDEYLEMTGKRYRNCALAIRKWGFDAIKGQRGNTKFHNFEPPSCDYGEIQKILRNVAIGEET